MVHEWLKVMVNDSSPMEHPGIYSEVGIIDTVPYKQSDDSLANYNITWLENEP